MKCWIVVPLVLLQSRLSNVTCRARETACAGEALNCGHCQSPARHRSHEAYLALSLQTLCNNKHWNVYLLAVPWRAAATTWPAATATKRPVPAPCRASSVLHYNPINENRPILACSNPGHHIRTSKSQKLVFLTWPYCTLAKISSQ